MQENEDDIRNPRPSVFAEHFHNDEKFEIFFIKDHNKAKNCVSCRVAIPREFLTVPYDMSIQPKMTMGPFIWN